MERLKKTRNDAAHKTKIKFILFCDNLKGQINQLILDEVTSFGKIVWFGVAYATDIW